MHSRNMVLFPGVAGDIPPSHTTGILPCQRIKDLVASGRIRSASEIQTGQIQPASIDLRLGPLAYRVRASFLPGESSTVEKKIRELQMGEVDLTKPAVFDRGCVYIVPLMEELTLPADIGAKANPRSTTGRLDIFTRLITDYGSEFEWVRKGYSGKLYAEIVSRTFSVVARAGTKLNQIRFIRGNPPSLDSTLADLHHRETLVYGDEDSPTQANIDKGLRISLDLLGDGGTGVVAYRARKHGPALQLDQVGFYDPWEFWDPIVRRRKEGIVLDPGDFYILASKEKIRVPPDYAAEMVPYDPSIGEFRIHYAGFFDPGFGYGLSDIRGTKAVLEVRAHEVPILVQDGQVVGRLEYTQMMEAPDRIYGSAIGSSYQHQGLMLSKQFKRLATVPEHVSQKK
jgi:dCTP deaminase